MERYPEWPNLAAMMFSRARQWPNRPMLRAFRNDAWVSLNWGDFARQAASVARRLRSAGVSAGDRVLIVSENRPEFPIVETALLAIRAVPVPAYTTYTTADFAHVLKDSGARVAVVSTAELARKIIPAGPLDLLVSLDDFTEGGVVTASFARLADDQTGFDDIAAEADLIPPGGLACLIYTSGTGGAPRGVMLPHKAILSTGAGAFLLLQMIGLQDETYLSFLPLSHAYEHTAGQFFMLSLGAEIVYARGVETLAADMLSVRPTIMTMVPRVLEVIRTRVLQQMAREKAWKRWLFNTALSAGIKKAEKKPRSLVELLLEPVLEALVRRKLRARFGGRLRVTISGGARLEPEIGRFYQGLGMLVIQGYGQTEAGPVISANIPTRVRIETVGPPLAGVDLRIASDGEILVRGDLVMDGYWGRPDETANAIRGGWLHTGDIGELDDAGNLRITDRKKDMIVLSGGDNISPARIEGMLIAEDPIAQAVVLGDGKPGLTALVVAAEGYDDIAVASAVNMVNKRLSVTERIRRHAVVAPFTIDNGLMTATQKVRRHLVVQEHAKVLEKLGG